MTARGEGPVNLGPRLAGWFLVAGLIVLAGYAGRAGGAPAGDTLYRYETAIGGAIVYLALLGAVVALGRGLDQRDFLALRRPDSWPRALGLTAATYAALLAGVAALLYALGAQDEQGLTPDAWDPDRAGQYAANFVVVALLGPAVEELLYRGAGISLLARFGAPAAVLVTALPFALGHGLVRAMPALILFGLLVGLLRLRTRSVYPCILAHSAFNATSLLVAVTA